MVATNLPALPEPVLAEIFQHVCDQGSVRERGQLAPLCTAARDAVATSWAAHAERDWGPLDWAAYFKTKHDLQVAELNSSQWGVLLVALESELRPRMQRSVKQVRLPVRLQLCSLARPSAVSVLKPRPNMLRYQAVLYLRSVHLLSGPQPEQEYAWLAHRLRASELHDRRRITSYVCVTSEDQPYKVLDSLIVRFELRPPSASPTIEKGDEDWEPVPPNLSPIVSLRHILLQFPFLPIDAGGGADRVIGAIARCYSAAHPEVSEWLGLPSTCSAKDRTEAVHLVVYGAIMLQSDLHNIAVQPKMTPTEFVDSLHRAPSLANMPEERIIAIYEDIRSAPLEYEEAIDSFVRSNKDGDGDDQVIAPSYSKYSRHSAAGNVQRLRGHCTSTCGSLQRRTGQLRTARGRKDLRFLAKRWHGQHYATIRICAFLLVLASHFVTGTGTGGAGRDEAGWAWDVYARTLILAVVCHVATKV
jgi:hypothetical protein